MRWKHRDIHPMQRALELAARGQGHVEPNPLVGCVIVARDKILAEGWHQRFGGPHAEIEALRHAGSAAKGSTLYVTLEPCCHHGKTPPCTDAILAAGIRRVVVAQRDPFPQVAGRGLRLLKKAGIKVETGLLADEARELNAPYLKLLSLGRPWVIAKWAMSLDGKMATRAGHSQWITNKASRSVAHAIRARVDAILVGRRTVELDDPLLTARPAGARCATRIVLDRQASISPQSQLIRTARKTPLLIVVSDEAPAEKRQQLTELGCEVWINRGRKSNEQLELLLDELGRRRFTNILVEGGAATLGGFRDADLVDEVHVFLAPIIVGGSAAPGPVGGTGAEQIADSFHLSAPRHEQLDGDWHIWGRIKR